MTARETFIELAEYPIFEVETAKDLIKAMVEANCEFHLEDDPHDIINHDTGERIFTDEEAEMIADRLDEMYMLDWNDECPIGYMMQIAATK